jgi:hypothetical protein
MQLPCAHCHRPNPLLDELTALFTESAHGVVHSSWRGDAADPLGLGGSSHGSVRHWPLFEEKNPGPDRTKVVLKYHSNIEDTLSRSYRNVIECLRQMEEPPRVRRRQAWGVFVFWGTMVGSIFGFVLALAFGLIALLVLASIGALVGLLLWQCRTAGSRLDEGMTGVFGRGWAGGAETAEDKRRRDMAEFQKHFLKVKLWCEMMVPDINAMSTVSFVRQSEPGTANGSAWETSRTPGIIPYDVGFSTHQFDGLRLARLIQLHRPWSQPLRSYESGLLISLAYRLSVWLDGHFERRPWHFAAMHQGRIGLQEPQRVPWTQLGLAEQDAAAALVEAHLRLSKKTQKRRSLWQFSAATALRQRSGGAVAVDIEQIWNSQDLAFNDCQWNELVGRTDVQNLASHLPAYEGHSWDQLQVQANLVTLGWSEATWDHSARVTTYLKKQAHALRDSSSANEWSSAKQSKSMEQGLHNAVLGASHQKAAMVNAAFAIVEKQSQYVDDHGVERTDTLFELRILDNRQNARIVTCILADSAGEKCTVDNETWFSDP